jgi:hypothetical protein
MVENTKDILTIWGLVFVGIMAVGFAFDHFGAIGGYLSLLPIIILGRRVIIWLEDLRYFRSLDEGRFQSRHDKKTDNS